MGNENKAQILSSILDPFSPLFGEEANVIQSARQQKIGSTALWINVIWMQIGLKQMSCWKMCRLWNYYNHHIIISFLRMTWFAFFCLFLSLLLPLLDTSIKNHHQSGLCHTGPCFWRLVLWITQWFEVEGTLKIIHFQSPYHGQGC